MPYAPTYRYAVGIYGASYAQPDQVEPEHWVMGNTLRNVEIYLYLAAHAGASGLFHENGAGSESLDTPNYGEPGDGAVIYRVNREHPDFSEVLDEPGDRAVS